MLVKGTTWVFGQDQYVEPLCFRNLEVFSRIQGLDWALLCKKKHSSLFLCEMKDNNYFSCHCVRNVSWENVLHESTIFSRLCGYTPCSWLVMCIHTSFSAPVRIYSVRMCWNGSTQWKLNEISSILQIFKCALSVRPSVTPFSLCSCHCPGIARAFSDGFIFASFL